MNSSCNDKFLKQAFFEHYPKSKDASVSFCPYRVCPIGAHIDHQYGKVTGFAIDKGISVFYSPNDEEIVRCVSTSFEGAKQFSIHDIPKNKMTGQIICVARRFFFLKNMNFTLV